MIQFVSNTEPWSHQVEGFQWLDDHTSAMLYFQMGTGKSKVVVDHVVNRPCDVTVILCPKSVVAVWVKQFRIHAGKPCHVVPLNKWTVAKRKEFAEKQIKLAKAKRIPCVLVMNYESVWRNPMGKWLLNLARKKKIGRMVLDESHRIKAPTGKASQFCGSIAGYIPLKVCLTGTPLPHSPLDAFGQFRFLDRLMFGWNFHRFKNRYAVMGGHRVNGRAVQVIGFQKLDELKRKIFTITKHVDGSVLDLPDIMPPVERIFQLEPAAAKVYKQIEKTFMAEVKDKLITASNALTKLLRLQQITSGFFLAEGEEAETEYASGKTAVLREVLEDVGDDEPVAVFCRFRHDLKSVAQVAKDLDRGSLELSGSKNELEEWQDGKAPVIAIQIQSGKEGVDLTRAMYAVYYSMGFSLGDYKQSLKRLHRPGQVRHVSYIHLMAEGTVDQKLMKALIKKQLIISQVLGESGDLWKKDDLVEQVLNEFREDIPF